LGLFFITLFTEIVKNTWGKNVNFKSKNSKMYNITDTHILLSNYKFEVEKNENDTKNNNCNHINIPTNGNCNRI